MVENYGDAGKENVEPQEAREVIVPSIKEFRDAVDTIRDQRHAIVIKSAYLSCARACELTLKQDKWDNEHNKSHPHGQHLTFSTQEFRYQVGKKDQIEKVLLLNYAVAKRKKKDKKGNPIIVRKIIALPTSTKFEPWTVDLLKHLVRYKTLSFNYTRFAINNMVKLELRRYFPDIHGHSLRHYRISHLAEVYGFDAFDITAYAGWTFKTALSATGQGGASGQLDTYLHLSWRRYFPKLLVNQVA